jgi:hypothetical protein
VRRYLPAVASALALFLVVPSCGGNGGERASEPAPTPTCTPVPEPPAGFEQTERFEDPYGDHVGVRLGFRDADGRELHAFAGIPGEFGEGLPVVAQVTVGDAGGALLGEGSVWVLSWDEGGPCGTHAVLASGFSEQEFRRLLADHGMVPEM